MKSIDLRRYLKIAISLIYYLLRGLCRASLRLIGRAPEPQLTILYYHGVEANCRSRFARQMSALHRCAMVLPASYRGKLPVEKHRKCVAITFDDAFVSVADNALPSLAKYSFHCTIFVPGAWLGRTPGWIMETDPRGSAPELLETVMSASQLKAVSSSLVSLASHTMTHPILPRLTPELAREELERSRRLVGELSGREVGELSFPYGEYDESTIALCRASSYETLYSVVPEEVDTRRHEILRGRTKVDPSDGPLEFFLKYKGAYEWMRYTRLAKDKFQLFRSRRPAAPRNTAGVLQFTRSDDAP